MLVSSSTHAINPARCGLYVHVPFCETKCGYCDFYSVPMKERDSGALISRVVCELQARLTQQDLLIRTIFLGGGTPTLLPTHVLATLLRSVTTSVAMQQVVEFTVEANPATVDDAKTELLVRHGVTRVSMGGQSFFATELATLERLHRPEDIPPSVALLRRHGITQVNLDLIFGIPGQTLDTWATSLNRTIDLGVDHIACYGLTYEPGTRLTAQRNAGKVQPCDENLEADMYELTVDTLARAGYEQYEISNFAKPARRCEHNMMYWRNEPYVGVGPSAAGRVHDRRYKNIADVNGYVGMIDRCGLAEAESETLTPATWATELLMMQLRLVEGLSIATFVERTDLDPRRQFREVLDRLTKLQLTAVSDTHITLTDKGRLVGDAIIAEFVCACGVDQRSLPVLS